MDGPKPKNYTATNDPNVVMGKYGAPITRDQFVQANKNGYAWKDFDSYADYVGSWAHPVDQTAFHPQYRAYGQKDPINGADVMMLAQKNEPKINEMINRNIAKPGEVPMYGPQDADNIRSLITAEKVNSQNTNHPDVGMYTAMTNAMQK